MRPFRPDVRAMWVRPAHVQLFRAENVQLFRPFGGINGGVPAIGWVDCGRRWVYSGLEECQFRPLRVLFRRGYSEVGEREGTAASRQVRKLDQESTLPASGQAHTDTCIQ